MQADILTSIMTKKQQLMEDFIDGVNGQDAVQERTTFIKENQSVPEDVQKKIKQNIDRKIKDEDKYHPDNMLNSISRKERTIGLQVRAKKLQNSFGIVISELNKFVLTLRAKAAEHRDQDNNYPTPEALAKAKDLGMIWMNSQSLLTMICGILYNLKTEDLLVLSTAILASGEPKVRLGQLIPQLENQGFDVKNLKDASKGVDDAIDDVNNVMLYSKFES